MCIYTCVYFYIAILLYIHNWYGMYMWTSIEPQTMEIMCC